MFNKIPSQKKLFLAFCTWCLLRIEYKSLAAQSSKHSKKFVEFLWVGAKIYSLLVFRKITFRIHLNFSPLAGTIFRPLCTSFCSCFVYPFDKITFFMKSTWYCTWSFMNFFLRKMFLPSTATSCSSLFSMVYHTLSMFHHKMFV